MSFPKSPSLRVDLFPTAPSGSGSGRDADPETQRLGAQCEEEVTRVLKTVYRSPLAAILCWRSGDFQLLSRVAHPSCQGEKSTCQIGPQKYCPTSPLSPPLDFYVSKVSCRRASGSLPVNPNRALPMARLIRPVASEPGFPFSSVAVEIRRSNDLLLPLFQGSVVESHQVYLETSCFCEQNDGGRDESF